MIPKQISLVAVLYCCLVATQALAKTIRDERREAHQHNRTGKLRGETSQTSLNTHRRLFAERWSDPSNPQRGGAGGAAKGLTEVVPMRPSPSVSVPTVQSPEQAPVSVPATPQPVIASTPAPQAPVSAPPVSMITTATPTQSPANRNDVCSRAKSVPVSAEGMGVGGVFLVEDTTLGAQIASAERCNTLATTAPGVWFVVPGTGHLMFASTCWPGTTYDTVMSVYSGSCGGLSCVTANDDAGGNLGVCEINNRASKVRWNSIDGEMYYILVHGFSTARFGDFQLNVVSAAPLNNNCEKAETIRVGDTVVSTTFQSDVPFRQDDAGNIPPECPSVYLAPGAWYRVVGTGGSITATTCNPLTQFETRLNIFDGSCSTRATCFVENTLPEGCSTVTWATQSGRDYFILVHSPSNGFVVPNGIFELSVL